MNVLKNLKKKTELWLHKDKCGEKIKLSELKKLNKKDFDDLYWSEEQLKLKESIQKGGYNPSKGTKLLISKDYVLINGHHRVFSLIETYGLDYEVEVDRIRLKYRLTLLVLFLAFILFGNDE